MSRGLIDNDLEASKLFFGHLDQEIDRLQPENETFGPLGDTRNDSSG